MKLLLYCTKAKPYLADFKGEYETYSNGKELDELWDKGFNLNDIMNILNGKIVAECDFEVEHIWCELFLRETEIGRKPEYKYYTETSDDITKESCLTYEQMDNYLQKQDISYAIHIKNLHIFDEPKKLNEYMNGKFEEWDYRDLYELEKAPQNMQYVSTWYCDEISILGSTYILISIKPEWLCKILNGEKTIEVRKKILKEMK